ncbi:unnamed protein product [Paramecium pentaurelia]|uniref:Uncharacterized protein n=1 Tax=Paramecium pentaurelia TaxID=43138 RepID=A0A8S1SXE9_9CILI|nr:unnamed protein product [Paramecium pentaurelia]
MLQDLKQSQVYDEIQQQISINEQPNQKQQMQNKYMMKNENDKKNNLNCRVQIFQPPQQLESLNITQNSINSSYHEIIENLYDKLQNKKQIIQQDNHVEKLQQSQKNRSRIQYKSFSKRYTNSEGSLKYEQKRQLSLQEDNQIDCINKYEYQESKYVQYGHQQNNVLQNYQSQYINEIQKKKQDQLSCQFYSKNTKKDMIKNNQTIFQRQIKEEQDHNDSSESNKSRISKNISEFQDQIDLQSKHEEKQSLRISKISEYSDQMKYESIENSFGYYFDSNKSSINHTPQMKSLKDIKINTQIPSLKIQKQDNQKYFSQASSPLQNTQNKKFIRNNPSQIIIDSSASQLNIISPVVKHNDSGLHKNTISFGQQQEYNSFKKPVQNKTSFFEQKSPINKTYEYYRKKNISKINKQNEQALKIQEQKSQSEKKLQNFEYEKKIKELEQELKLKEEQLKFKDDIINEQIDKIKSYSQRINQIPNEDDWNSDFHNICEFIDDYQRNIYQLISHKNSNKQYINLMKQKFQEQYKDKLNQNINNNQNQKNQQKSEQQTNPEIINIQKHQILQPIFENMIMLQQKSITFGFEFGHTIQELFQKLFFLSKREKFRIRLLDMNECLKYEIQELINFLKNQKNNQNINELKEALESEINIQKYIYQTIFNITNLFKERIMQIQEGHKQMQEQLKKNTHCN